MNVAETAGLLARIAAADRRTVGEVDIEVWSDALCDLDYDDCETAVRALTRDTSEWITPHAVRVRVKAIRRDRIERSQTDWVPDADPDDPQAYIAALRAGRMWQASGTRSMSRADLDSTFRSVPAITKGNRP